LSVMVTPGSGIGSGNGIGSGTWPPTGCPSSITRKIPPIKVRIAASPRPVVKSRVSCRREYNNAGGACPVKPIEVKKG